MASIPGLQKQNLLILPPTFQLWISTSTALNLSSLQAEHSYLPSV